jgi:hypothetical protein
MNVRATTLAHLVTHQRQAPHLVGRLVREVAASVPAVEGLTQDMAGYKPKFVISTEGEATDNNIVRQFWDLQRAEGVGVPCLWNHDPDELLGRWEELTVEQVDGKPALCGRIRFDQNDPEAKLRQLQVRDGILSGISVGWIPGAMIRRGDLDPSDPLYKEPVDGPCGPEEGYVMGSPEQPNILMEGTLTPVPADPAAVVTERLARKAQAELEAAQRGGPVSVEALLAVAADHPKVRAFLQQMVRAELGNPAPAAPTLSQMFPGGKNAR